MSTATESTKFDLASLVTEHQANIWRYLRYLGATPSDADDLTQETFLAVNRASFQQRSPQQTAAYLRTVARNQLLQARRREGREIDTVELTAAEQVWASVTNRDQYLSSLADCLEKLEGRARTAIIRFYSDRQGRAEIAKELDMKPAGVKTLLRRTRDLLRQCIQRTQ